MTFRFKFPLMAILAVLMAFTISGCIDQQSVMVDTGSHHYETSDEGKTCHKAKPYKKCDKCQKHKKPSYEGKTCQKCEKCQGSHHENIMSMKQCCKAKKSGRACHAYNCGDSKRGCIKWCATH